MAGYDGYSKSNNAIDAEAAGKFPMTTAIREVRNQTGCTVKTAREALIAEGPCEWHHTSRKYNKTNYYDTGEAVKRIHLSQAAASWPADWLDYITDQWPSSDTPVNQRIIQADALLRRVANEFGTTYETLSDACYTL